MERLHINVLSGSLKYSVFDEIFSLNFTGPDNFLVEDPGTRTLYRIQTC